MRPEPRRMTTSAECRVFARSPRLDERLERSAAVEFGGAGAATEYIMTPRKAQDGAAVQGTFTLAIKIGESADTAVATDPALTPRHLACR